MYRDVHMIERGSAKPGDHAPYEHLLRCEPCRECLVVAQPVLTQGDDRVRANHPPGIGQARGGIHRIVALGAHQYETEGVAVDLSDISDRIELMRRMGDRTEQSSPDQTTFAQGIDSGGARDYAYPGPASDKRAGQPEAHTAPAEHQHAHGFADHAVTCRMSTRLSWDTNGTRRPTRLRRRVPKGTNF